MINPRDHDKSSLQAERKTRRDVRVGDSAPAWRKEAVVAVAQVVECFVYYLKGWVD